MKLRYIDFIQQTYDFPQGDFSLDGDQLMYKGIDLMQLVKKYGTPLKFSYLPKITENIQNARNWFKASMKKHHYGGDYQYCYCTKSSHFAHVLRTITKSKVNIETSFATDLDIVKTLYDNHFNYGGKIVCNGFKTDTYLEKILEHHAMGKAEVIAVLDNKRELKLLDEKRETPLKIGIRIASEEEPKFEFYTSRLGIGYKDIIPFYRNQIMEKDSFELSMLHFFINTGIRDTAYYWNELFKCLNVYVQLKKICPSLNSFNIGGGFPIQNSLAFEYEYDYIIDEIVSQIKKYCQEANVPEPDIYTEFGSYTVGESGGSIFRIIHQKKQNDRERWNMIDSSFMTNIPDAWALSKRFLMMPINRWEDNYERVFLGGLTCDSDDYYNSEQHVNAIYLPQYLETKPLYIVFFHTGAYQESLGGFGGYQHCLIPNPKHIVIDKDEAGEIEIIEFVPQQSSEQMLHLLGYK